MNQSRVEELIERANTVDEHEPRIITRKMIEENLDVEKGVITTEGTYQDMPIYIPYYHSMVLEGMYDYEQELAFYFELDQEDYMEFPELLGCKTLVICLSDFSEGDIEIDYELF